MDKSSAKKIKMKRDSPSDDGGGGGVSVPVRKGKKRRIKKIMVDHTYRDFSKLSLESVAHQLRLAGQEVGCDLVGASCKTFPQKLYQMVINPQYQHIIRFMPHGRGWVLLDKEALASEVLPKYFQHSNFESFNRQVNGWGFKRLMKRGPDYKSYYHELFLRGRPDLPKLMIRLVNPGKRIPDMEREPDFYEISRRSPLPEIGGAVSLDNRVISGNGQGGIYFPYRTDGLFRSGLGSARNETTHYDTQSTQNVAHLNAALFAAKAQLVSAKQLSAALTIANTQLASTKERLDLASARLENTRHVTLLTQHVAQLTAALSAASARNETNRNVTLLTQQVAQLTAALSATNAQLASDKNDRACPESEPSASLTTTHAHLASANDEAARRVSALTTANAQLPSSQGQLRGELASARNETSRHETQSTKDVAQLVSAKNEGARRESELSAGLTTANAQLALMKEQVQSTEHVVAQLIAELSAAKAQLASAKNEGARRESELSAGLTTANAQLALTKEQVQSTQNVAQLIAELSAAKNAQLVSAKNDGALPKSELSPKLTTANAKLALTKDEGARRESELSALPTTANVDLASARNETTRHDTQSTQNVAQLIAELSATKAQLVSAKNEGGNERARRKMRGLVVRATEDEAARCESELSAALTTASVDLASARNETTRHDTQSTQNVVQLNEELSAAKVSAINEAARRESELSAALTTANAQLGSSKDESTVGGINIFTSHKYRQASLHPSAPTEAPQGSHAQDPLHALRLSQAVRIELLHAGTDNFSSSMRGLSGIPSKGQGMSNRAQFAQSQVMMSVGKKSTADDAVRKLLTLISRDDDNEQHSVVSVDRHDIFEKRDISDYDVEPPPLSESPLQINPYFISMDDYVSNIKKPGPLLEDYAGINLSNAQSLSDSIHK